MGKLLRKGEKKEKADDELKIEDIEDLHEGQEIENQQSLARHQPDRSSGGEGEYHSMAVVNYADQYSGILKSKQTPR